MTSRHAPSKLGSETKMRRRNTESLMCRSWPAGVIQFAVGLNIRGLYASEGEQR
jgi:hypothetical protein